MKMQDLEFVASVQICKQSRFAKDSDFIFDKNWPPRQFMATKKLIESCDTDGYIIDYTIQRHGDELVVITKMEAEAINSNWRSVDVGMKYDLETKDWIEDDEYNDLDAASKKRLYDL